MKNIISANQLSKKEIEKILISTAKMEKEYKSGKIKQLLKNKVVACVFFEPSTRTRLSFETATLRLGGEVISSENASNSSSSYKGESIEDMTRMLCSYADIVVVRHREAGSVGRAASVATKPIINAGDGANQHPTQGLLDLYTIQKEQGRLTNLKIGFGGDLLNSRTLHSLLPFLMLYKGNKFYFLSPKKLELPRKLIQELKDNNILFEELTTLSESLPHLDVLYMTRVQKERFSSISAYNKVKDLFILKKEDLKNMKKSAIIMHPLPKINEIEKDIDLDPRAAYFRQAQNGLYVRMALLLHVLGL